MAMCGGGFRACIGANGGAAPERSERRSIRISPHMVAPSLPASTLASGPTAVTTSAAHRREQLDQLVGD